MSNPTPVNTNPFLQQLQDYLDKKSFSRKYELILLLLDLWLKGQPVPKDFKKEFPVLWYLRESENELNELGEHALSEILADRNILKSFPLIRLLAAKFVKKNEAYLADWDERVQRQPEPNQTEQALEASKAELEKCRAVRRAYDALESLEREEKAFARLQKIARKMVEEAVNEALQELMMDVAEPTAQEDEAAPLSSAPQSPLRDAAVDRTFLLMFKERFGEESHRLLWLAYYFGVSEFLLEHKGVSWTLKLGDYLEVMSQLREEGLGLPLDALGLPYVVVEFPPESPLKADDIDSELTKMGEKLLHVCKGSGLAFDEHDGLAVIAVMAEPAVSAEQLMHLVGKWVPRYQARIITSSASAAA